MSTNTVITVPSWAQDYVKQYGQRAYDLWNLPSFVAYTGQIVASQAQNEADGIAALATRGEAGDLVISKATAFILDVIQGNRLAGTKQEFIDALALVTGNSTTDFAAVNSRIGKKARYVGDPDSTFLAQALATGYPATFNARISAAIHADNYSKERVFRDHALAYGVEMGKHPVIDAETLRKAGLANRDYLQNSYVLNHKYFIEGQEMAVANLPCQPRVTFRSSIHVSQCARIEEDRVTSTGHECIPEHLVAAPLSLIRACGVTDVVWIEAEDSWEVQLFQ